MWRYPQTLLEHRESGDQSLKASGLWIITAVGDFARRATELRGIDAYPDKEDGSWKVALDFGSDDEFFLAYKCETQKEAHGFRDELLKAIISMECFPEFIESKYPILDVAEFVDEYLRKIKGDEEA